MRVCEIDRVQEDGRCRETVRDRVREREGERVREREVKRERERDCVLQWEEKK